MPLAKRPRYSDILPSGSAPAKPAAPKKQAARQPLSAPKPQKRRSNAFLGPDFEPTTTQKLNFCADLLSRMLSGPGKSSSLTPLVISHD
jgi:hypothetical protein